MDQREARRYTSSNPPSDPIYERRPSLLARLFRRSSSIDEGSVMTAGLQRRGSIDPQEVTTTATTTQTSITQRVQTEMPGATRKNSTDFHIFS